MPDTVRPAETDPRGRTGLGPQGRAPTVEVLGEPRGRKSDSLGHTGVRHIGHPATEVRTPEGHRDVLTCQPRVSTAAAAEHGRQRVPHRVLHV